MSNIISGICGKCHKYYQGSWCPHCEKIDGGQTLNFILDFHDDYYDHGLGEVVRSKQHRRELMKEKGLEEVGNEKIDPRGNREKKDREFVKRMNDKGMEYLHKCRN